MVFYSALIMIIFLIKGIFLFDNEGILLVSSLLGKEDKKILGLDKNTKLKLSKKKKEYLKWHREYIFKV